MESAGPLSPDIVCAKSPCGGRQATHKRARDAATTSGESSGQATNLDERMLVAFESSVELLALSEERKEMSGKDKGGKIKALLDECGPFMTPEEKMKWGREHISVYIKDIEDTHHGAAQSDGGGGM